MIEFLEAALKAEYEREKLDGSAFFASDDWTEMKSLVGDVFSMAERHITSCAEGEPILPTFMGRDNDGMICIAAIPELSNPDVRVRRAVAAMVPDFMKTMGSKSGIMIREAWTVSVTATDPAVVNNILPSEDDRRISVVMMDLIAPRYQFLVNFKINEKAERSVNPNPVAALIAKHDGKMLQAEMVNFGDPE